MSKRSLSLILLLTCSTAHSQNCTVKEISSGNEKPCVFPFIYKGKAHNICTDQDDPDGLSWCSTETDENGVHVGQKGLWGHCENEECEKTVLDDEEEVKQMTDEEGLLCKKY